MSSNIAISHRATRVVVEDLSKPQPLESLQLDPYREEHERPILHSTVAILARGHEAHVSGIRVRLL